MIFIVASGELKMFVNDKFMPCAFDWHMCELGLVIEDKLTIRVVGGWLLSGEDFISIVNKLCDYRNNSDLFAMIASKN